MSLQLIAKQMEAKGRGGDSLLVHMTPEEVAGLQKLAESAGGSLTVNPETGLVEANFLKRMLPTLVGIGVGAFAGPVAGAAAGAAVGGYQAKRNDQDVGLGMLMGGLGGYGGGAMGAGLTAAGAGAAAGAAAPTAAGATAAPMTASQTLSQAGQGLSAIGTDAAKRAAFAKSVGMSGVGMAAAPMMAPEKAPGPTPTDDEMYAYTFNPGRTGAERNPTATSSEREYFQSSYSPMRKIRASEYGFAEGGETAAPAAEAAAPSASEVALAYLMGERSSSSAGLPALAARAPSTPTSNVGVGGDNMYAFDPATGSFIRNPNVAGANSAAVGSPVGTSFAGIGGSDYVDPNPGWTNMSNAEKAAYYAENPTMANITGIGQSLFGMTSLGQLQNYLDPEGVAASRDMVSQAPAPVVDRQGMDSGGGNGGGYASDYGSQSYGGEQYGDSPMGTYAAGGLMGLAKGGMASGGFVVPADVVSALGNGSTDAGLRKLNSMMGQVKPIKGKGDGLSDSIPTNIDGKQRAKVADGEAYIDPNTVKRLGGAKKLYAMMDKVRAQAHGKTTQQRPVNPAKVMA